ncbi:MAG: hypothetical protein KGS45_13905 [Planctomycetes bacterium]|nr:hypothetical protein [Planctomycetota bacterium]
MARAEITQLNRRLEINSYLWTFLGLRTLVSNCNMPAFAYSMCDICSDALFYDHDAFENPDSSIGECVYDPEDARRLRRVSVLMDVIFADAWKDTTQDNLSPLINHAKWQELECAIGAVLEYPWIRA